MKKSSHRLLGPLQVSIMEILWVHGPLTTSQVVDIVHESGSKLAYTTVLTVLRNLTRRGLVFQDGSHKPSHLFIALCSKESYLRSVCEIVLEDQFLGNIDLFKESIDRYCKQQERNEKYRNAQINPIEP